MNEIELGLEQRRWIVGKSASCDIVVDDPYVSSTHCTLERRADGTLMVRDRRSRNGTLIDGNLVEAAELKVGSTLKLGHYALKAVSGAPGGASGAPSALEQLCGSDPKFREVVDHALRAAQAHCSILVVGETGTGKDLLARAIHEASPRSRESFVPVNCGAIPRELIGSELFGHEKGAFTGATSDRDGYFVEADGGTLFLDELGELPLEMQPHLLRALETRQVRRIGGNTSRRVDVRIIAATNRLDGLGTEQSRLRMDLYHRVATVVLVLPPLRERMNDVHELVTSMLKGFEDTHGRRSITLEGWQALLNHSWPGNVRELLHAVQRAVTLGGPQLGPDDFFDRYHQQQQLRWHQQQAGASSSANTPLSSLTSHLPPLPAGMVLANYELITRAAMAAALETHKTIRAAAAHLGMAKSTFADKARLWGLLDQRRKYE